MKFLTKFVPGYELTFRYGFDSRGVFRIEGDARRRVRHGQTLPIPLGRLYDDFRGCFPEMDYLVRWAQAEVDTTGTPSNYREDCLYYRDIVLGLHHDPNCSVEQARARLLGKMVRTKLSDAELCHYDRFTGWIDARLTEIADEFRQDMALAGIQLGSIVKEG